MEFGISCGLIAGLAGIMGGVCFTSVLYIRKRKIEADG